MTNCWGCAELTCCGTTGTAAQLGRAMTGPHCLQDCPASSHDVLRPATSGKVPFALCAALCSQYQRIQQTSSNKFVAACHATGAGLLAQLLCADFGGFLSSTAAVLHCRTSPYFLRLSQPLQEKAAKDGGSTDEVEKYSDRCAAMEQHAHSSRHRHGRVSKHSPRTAALQARLSAWVKQSGTGPSMAATAACSTPLGPVPG